MFATSLDLETRLGESLTASEHERGHRLLELATALIRRDVRQHVSLVEGDTLARRGAADARIRLPERPVLEVTSVKLDGDELAGWYVDGDELVRRRDTRSPGGGFGCPEQTLEIVYTHGLDPVPGEVTAVALEMVVRVWVNPGAVQQKTIGPTSTTYGFSAPSGLLLTAEERRTVRDALRLSCGSVTLR